MLFIWKGYGFLVPLITIFIVGITSISFSAVFKNTQPYGVPLGALLAAIAIWYVGNAFNSPKKDKVLIDRTTGQEFIYKPDHSLFFVKMQYWAYIVGAIGVFLLASLLFSNR